MEEMKLKVGQDYYRKVRKVLESGLNGHGQTVMRLGEREKKAGCQ